MAAQHIYGLYTAVIYLLRPGNKDIGLCAVYCVDEEAGEKEIIGHITLLGNRLIYSFLIACMYFRKKSYTVFIRKLSDL